MSYSNPQPLLDPLTDREVEVLQLMVAGHSNREIANDLFITVETTRWYTKQIYSKMGVHSRKEAITMAQSMGLGAEADKTATLIVPEVNQQLPSSLTPLVGRDTEIAEIKSLLARSRLITLSGPGGSGKTRLAVQVAAELAEKFAKGIYFIDLASIIDPALVAPTIASVIGIDQRGSISTEEALHNTLRDREILLLIDNFEQVIDAAPLISDLLANTNQPRILVTSREVLRIYGEHEYPVPPLKLPDLKSGYTSQDLAQFPAVDLFMQRAQAVNPNFVLDSDNTAIIAEICVRLDGLPLVLELAAARIRLFTPQALLARLDERFKTLTSKAHGIPERQQTLQAAIDWSYNLLDETEQRFFARLSVFSGGRSLEAIEAVCGGDLDADVFDLLESLLNKSLLRQEEDTLGEPRFFMLETIHEYARQRLHEQEEADTLYRRQAEYFTALAERGAPYLRRHQQDFWYIRLETEFDNFRTALSWTLGGGHYELGGRIVAALRDLWNFRGHHLEGLAWANRALAISQHLSEPIHAWVLLTVGLLNMSRQNMERATELFSAARQLGLSLQDQSLIAWASTYVAGASIGQQDSAASMIPLAKESLSLFRELEDKPGVAQALNMLGELSRTIGQFDDALEYYRECRDISLETGEMNRVVMQYLNMSYIMLRREIYDEIKPMMREALHINVKAKNQSGTTIIALQLVAAIECAMGDINHAVQLISAGDRWLSERGIKLQPGDQPEYEQILAMIQQRLDDETFERAWQQGYSMSVERAIEFALELLDR